MKHALTNRRRPTYSVPLLDALEKRELLTFDPTNNEQYLFELLNRMRLHPAEELGLLTTSLGVPAHSSNADVNNALNYFHTSGPILQEQWNELTAAPPLAWNAFLYAAAEGHNSAMIAADQQTHQAPGELSLGPRITAAGYTGWSLVGENVFAFATGVIHAHAGFALDWGGDPNDPNTTGIQNPPGHRHNMMDPTYREVGIRFANPGIVAGHQVGPLVVTQDFGRRSGQGNPFLLGVVYGDTSTDGYTAGEGFGGVTITAVGANGSPGADIYTTTSMTAGGWQMQVPAGTYAVTFSGAGWGNPVTYFGVDVASQNVKLDAVQGALPPAPIIQLTGNGMVIGSGDTSPNRNDWSDLGNANLSNQNIVRTFVIRNNGNQTLHISGGLIRVQISGANANDFILVSDAATFVAPGGTTSFTIAFDPGALGLRTATVTIHNDDQNAPTYTFSIQGHGIQRPVEKVTGNQVTINAGDTSPTTGDWTNFGGIDAKFATKVRIFNITNVGLLTLNLNGEPAVTITGPGASFFAVFVQPNASLAPGASTQFRVRFSPNGFAGIQQATVHIISNDAVYPDFTFAIQGNGLALPRIQVTGGGVVIAPGDNTPDPLDKTDYGSVAVAGTANRVRLFTITNLGLAPLNLTGILRVAVGGTNSANFIITAQPTLGSLAPGQIATFKIKFDPSAAGSRNAIVSIATNDPLLGAGLFTFAIGGVGI